MKKFKLLNAKAMLMPNGNVVVYNETRTNVFLDKKENYVDETTVLADPDFMDFQDKFEYEEIKESYFNKFRKEMPKDGDEYYYISICGGIYYTTWMSDSGNFFRFYNNNCFDTKENAEYYKDQEQRSNKLIKRMEIEFAKGGEIDWSDSKLKICIDLYVSEILLQHDCSVYYKTSNLPHCLDEKIIKRFILDHEEELIEYFKWEIEKTGGKI